MSIHADSRQYGSDEEYAEWKRDLEYEYRKQEYLDRLAEERERKQFFIEPDFDDLESLDEEDAD